MPRFDSKTLSHQVLEQLYVEEHLPVAEIAERLGCGETTIFRALDRYGIPVRAKRDYRTEISRNELERLYIDEGLSEGEIANRYGCAQTTISRRLNEFGIPRRNVGGIPKYRSPIHLTSSWSAQLAYAVGLIATDGSLDKDRRRVEFISTDKELIDLYCYALGLTDIHVVVTPQRFRKSWYKVKFSDDSFRMFLEQIGLTPNKSKTLGELDIPDSTFRDFLRGVMEGDGSWYISKKWFGRYQYLRVELCSASRVFIEWIDRKIAELGGLHGKLRTRSHGRYHYLTFLGRQAVALGEWIYYSPDVLALSRKYQVWEPFQNERTEQGERDE